MKPMRSLANSWISNLPRERRAVMVSLAVLMTALGALVIYQRIFVPPMEPGGPNLTANQANMTGQPTQNKAPATPAEPADAKPVEAAVKAPTRLDLPLQGQHKVLNGFSFGYSEIFKDYRMNPGIDFEAKAGEQVRAAAPGTVVGVDLHDPEDGVVVTVDHGGGLLTRYAGVDHVAVKPEGKVEAGTVLGQVGTPGPVRSKLGTHLHFETRLNGESVDPAPYFGR